jgi:geranylgeranyl diphosphate synthase type II
MMRHSLEGQAIELGWIRDNVCDLVDDDYYRMCLKKTSWYTCIYPCRAGALIATEGRFEVERLDRFGWYLGAAFQIQDDLLNLVGDYGRYGKEIAGDLWEGKRTLMLIHLLRTVSPDERESVRAFLGKRRNERTGDEVRWLHGLLAARGSLEFARQAARELAAAALAEGEVALHGVPDSEDKRFLLEATRYVIERDR